MALVDITNNWVVDGTASDTLAYQDGTSVGYSYTLTSVPGRTGEATPGANVEAPGENLTDGAGIGDRDIASITFDEPVTGFVVNMSNYNIGETSEISVDGETIDLNAWIAAGKIRIIGESSTGDGENLVRADGLYDGDETTDPDEDNRIYFLEPVSSVSITSFTTAADPGTRTHHDFFIDDSLPPCFTAGTLIETAQGPVPVEALQVGDLIRTKDHGFQPVKWVGGSRVMDAPVRIAAGTFGNARDLVVSPRHRMLVQGWQVDLMFNQEQVFATAGHLKNGTTITQEPEGWVEYFHVLLDRHEVIYAEGAETESFFPDEASLNSMAKATREALAKAVDLSTFGRTARPTLTANQAMYLSHNMDLLEDDADQIAAE